MRALSITPVLLLAVTIFVAAAPAGDHFPHYIDIVTRDIDSRDSSSEPLNLTGDASDANATVSSPADDSTKRIKDIVSDASGKLAPLRDKLSVVLLGSDPYKVDLVFSEITTVISDTLKKLQTCTKDVDLTQSNLSSLGPVLFKFATLLNSILFKLIPAVKGVLPDSTTNTLECLSDLLTSVSKLTGFLKQCVIGPHILRPIFRLVDCILNTVASLFRVYY